MAIRLSDLPAEVAQRFAAKPRKSKYGNTRCEMGGLAFDSKAEAQRYGVLQLLERQGIVANLRRQVPYELAPACVLDGKTRRARIYKADFVYEYQGQTVVEDAKGFETPEFTLKRHLMRTVHGIEVVIFRESK